MEFHFYIDIKETSWTRNHYRIGAENQEEANQMMLNQFNGTDFFDSYDTEAIGDINEMSPEENDGQPTKELYINNYGESKKLLIDNTTEKMIILERIIDRFAEDGSKAELIDNLKDLL